MLTTGLEPATFRLRDGALPAELRQHKFGNAQDSNPVIDQMFQGS